MFKSRSEQLVEQMNELNTRIESAAIGIINSSESLVQSPQLLTSLASSPFNKQILKKRVQLILQISETLEHLWTDLQVQWCYPI